MNIFAFAASLREGSRNRQLLDLATGKLEDLGVEVDAPHFSEFDVPLYNQDIQDESGIAGGALRLAEKLEASDGFIIVTPEYNHSMPGTLKNLIDWASRIRPEQPFRGKVGMLMSASPSMVGGSRGAYHLRQPFTALGVRMYPDMFSLARAHNAYDEEGKLADEALSDRLTSTLDDFVDFVGRLSSGPESG
ncbi:MAG: NADPH-dependent FMN reductase [Myxococcota bacterium]